MLPRIARIGLVGDATGAALERRGAACYLGLVTARHIALSIGALGVLVLGVYLLVAVRAQPDEAAVASAPTSAPSVPVERASPAAHPVAAPAADARAAPPASSGGAPSWVPSRPLAPAATPAAPGSATDPADGEALAGPKLEAVMGEANKAYDRGDYDDAKTIASRVLARDPSNVRMLRIVVSASCIDGDSAAAQASFIRLPAADQAQMRTRCARYGVAFPTFQGP
jgi:hypothetical protein